MHDPACNKSGVSEILIYRTWILGFPGSVLSWHGTASSIADVSTLRHVGMQGFSGREIAVMPENRSAFKSQSVGFVGLSFEDKANLRYIHTEHGIPGTWCRMATDHCVRQLSNRASCGQRRSGLLAISTPCSSYFHLDNTFKPRRRHFTGCLNFRSLATERRRS